MAVGREQRRIQRRERVSHHFAETDVDPALDLLEMLEIAWHDCYGDVTPSEDIVDDVLILSAGELAGLIRSAHLAITDWRDLNMEAAAIRNQRHRER